MAARIAGIGAQLSPQIAEVLLVHQPFAGLDVGSDPAGHLAGQRVDDLPGEDGPRLVVRTAGPAGAFARLRDRARCQLQPASASADLRRRLLPADGSCQPDAGHIGPDLQRLGRDVLAVPDGRRDHPGHADPALDRGHLIGLGRRSR